MIEAIEKMQLVKTSYSSNDVHILLKDLTNKMVELPTEEREKQIQNGVHYSEMLPKEKEPSPEYMDLYERALQSKTQDIALGVARIAEQALLKSGYIYSGNKTDKPVIVSLARAGIPIGILMKRYIKKRYDLDCEHFAISIIRDKGIDVNAMNFIYESAIKPYGNDASKIMFVDGWTGKGMIQKQLVEAVSEMKSIDSRWENLSSDLFVLADPANITEYCGTRKDYLLPSACLNSTISGLISRTILNSNVNITHGDFHGAVYFKRFEDLDVSNEFIEKVAINFTYLDVVSRAKQELNKGWDGMKMTLDICNKYGVADFKKVKPGIGETTRVLLRRVPWKVLINKSVGENDRDIEHIRLLCKEKNVPIEYEDLGNYKVCGIIKELSADV